jgi:hypothetical protein
MDIPEKSKNAYEAPQQALMVALNFTDADLKANREGYLSLQQRVTLNGKPPSLRLTIAGVLLALVVSQAILGLAYTEPDPDSAEGIYTLVFGVRLITLLVCLKTGLEYSMFQPEKTPFRKKREVRRVTDTVYRKRTINKNNIDTKYPVESLHLQISGLTFYVSEPVYDAFIHDRRYTIYYYHRSAKLLSAEVADEE